MTIGGGLYIINMNINKLSVVVLVVSEEWVRFPRRQNLSCILETQYITTSTIHLINKRNGGLYVPVKYIQEKAI